MALVIVQKILVQFSRRCLGVSFIRELDHFSLQRLGNVWGNRIRP